MALHPLFCTRTLVYRGGEGNVQIFSHFPSHVKRRVTCPLRTAARGIFTFSVHFRCAFSFTVAVSEFLVKVTMFIVCLNALSSPFDNLQRLLSTRCVSEYGLMDQAFGVLSRSPVLVFFVPLLPCLTVMFLFRNHNNKNDHSCLHTC